MTNQPTPSVTSLYECECGNTYPCNCQHLQPNALSAQLPTPSAVTDEIVREHYQILKAMNEMGDFVFKQRESKQSDDYERARWHLTEQNKQLANLQAQVDEAKEAVTILHQESITPKCQICNWTNVGCLNLGDVWMCHGCIVKERDSLRQQLITCQAAMEVQRETLKSVYQCHCDKGESCACGISINKALSPTSGSELLAKVEAANNLINEFEAAFAGCLGKDWADHAMPLFEMLTAYKTLTPTTGQSIRENVSDDNEPITREWLTSQGFEPVESDMGSNYPDHYQKGSLNIWEFNDTGRWLLIQYDTIEMKTRGKLRMLAKLIDVELK